MGKRRLTRRQQWRINKIVHEETERRKGKKKKDQKKVQKKDKSKDDKDN